MSKLDLLAITIVARDMIEKGWTKGTWYRKEGENEFVCVEGAFQQAMQTQIKSEVRLSLCAELNALNVGEAEQIVEQMSLALRRKREQLVFNYLCTVLGVQSIPTWNDASSRQKHEVLALFDKLIAQLQDLGEAERVVELEQVRA